MPTTTDLLAAAAREIARSDEVDRNRCDPPREAETLLERALGKRPVPGAQVPAPAGRRFRRLVERRAAGEPLAYLLGQTTFMGLTLEVSRGAFVPRTGTELLVRHAVQRLRSRHAPVHVDLATGVGPVPLAVARAVPHARIFGVDIAPRPLAHARGNAMRLGASNVRFLRGDLYEPLPRDLEGEVDVVTSYAPYIRRGQLRYMANEVTRHEPIESLTDFSRTGLSLMRRIAKGSRSWLRPGGWIVLQTSRYHARGVAGVLREAGFRSIQTKTGGITFLREFNRVLVARR